jgi:hypothetical protein
LRRRRIIANDKTAFSEFGQDDKYNADNDSDNSEDFDNVQEVQTSVPTSNERNIKPPAQNHPELEDLYLMDLIRGERIHANDYYPVDNEFMSGKMIFMCRTSDADLKTERPKVVAFLKDVCKYGNPETSAKTAKLYSEL